MTTLTVPTLRPPTLADVPAVAVVINAESQRLRGRDDVDERMLHGWFTQPPPFDLVSDVVVADRDGRVVGYGDLADTARDGAAIWLDVRGDEPAAVLDELTRRALERLAPGGVIRTMADELDVSYRAALAERGFATVRSSFQMIVDLDRVPDLAWPPGVTARAAVAGVDEPLLHELVERSFTGHWGWSPTPADEWLHWLWEMGEADPSLWFVAESAGEAVGVALCRPRHHGDTEEAWVATLGVVPEQRRRGIGTTLLAHALTVLRDRGFRRASLGVDAENRTGAVGLYERVGMTVAERYETWERRP